MRGPQLSAGYTVNTYSKPPLYDAIVKAMTSGFPKALVFAADDVDLFIARIDTRQKRLTTRQSDNTQLKARNYSVQNDKSLLFTARALNKIKSEIWIRKREEI